MECLALIPRGFMACCGLHGDRQHHARSFTVCCSLHCDIRYRARKGGRAAHGMPRRAHRSQTHSPPARAGARQPRRAAPSQEAQSRGSAGQATAPPPAGAAAGTRRHSASSLGAGRTPPLPVRISSPGSARAQRSAARLDHGHRPAVLVQQRPHARQQALPPAVYMSQVHRVAAAVAHGAAAGHLPRCGAEGGARGVCVGRARCACRVAGGRGAPASRPATTASHQSPTAGARPPSCVNQYCMSCRAAVHFPSSSSTGDMHAHAIY